MITDGSGFSLLDMESYRIIFNEFVHGVIEVKTNLDKTELIDACDKIKIAKNLPKNAYMSPVGPMKGRVVYGQTYHYMPTAGLIFAMDGPKIETIAQHLADWCSGKSCSEIPDSIWVLGKGYIQWISPVNGNLDPSPSPGSDAAVLGVPSVGDVLFPLVLHLGLLFGESWSRPIDLRKYAREDDLGMGIKRIAIGKSILPAVRQCPDQCN